MPGQFVPFAGAQVPGRLCNQPGAQGEPFECVLEGGSFVTDAPAPADELVVLAYNVERGSHWRGQLAMLAEDANIPSPDVILLSEADRGCTRTGEVNVPLEYARSLRMNYVYGVEFVELPRCIEPTGRIKAPCEHGNAILSRYPIGNVRLIRHTKNRSWNVWWQRLFRIGEPRLGGRMALAADLDIGGRLLRVYVVHFESKGGDDFRPAQAAEVGEDGLQAPDAVLIGGDMNFGAYRSYIENGEPADAGAQSLLGRGYIDAHASLPLDQRFTTQGGGIIDCLFIRGISSVDVGVGSGERWDALSNHRPVWARVSLR